VSPGNAGGSFPCSGTLVGSVYEMSRHSFRRRTESHPGHRSVAGGLARAAVFGASDGLVSNVSLVIGFAGAGVDSKIVRLAGLAGAIAGATSMAAGEWVSISAQNELVYRELDVERRELVHNTASETAELAAIYEGHGMTRQIALDAANDVMREPEAALAVHAREELGVDPNELGSPWSAAALSLVCFLVGALLPVIPWFAGHGNGAKLASIGIGVVAAAVIGLMIGKFAERRLLWSATRQVMILLIACGATYLVGKALGVGVS
jgi:vacuolar iron transporter family protein